MWADFVGEDYRCGFLGGCCVLQCWGNPTCCNLEMNLLLDRSRPELQPGKRAHLFPHLRMSSALHFVDLWQETRWHRTKNHCTSGSERLEGTCRSPPARPHPAGPACPSIQVAMGDSEHLETPEWHIVQQPPPSSLMDGGPVPPAAR